LEISSCHPHFARSICKGKDVRCAQFFANNGANWWWTSLFKVFVLYGLLIWITASPIYIMQYDLSIIGALSLLGFGIWLLRFIFETTGDLQLERFKPEILPYQQGKIPNFRFMGFYQASQLL